MVFVFFRGGPLFGSVVRRRFGPLIVAVACPDLRYNNRLLALKRSILDAWGDFLGIYYNLINIDMNIEYILYIDIIILSYGFEDERV